MGGRDARGGEGGVGRNREREEFGEAWNLGRQTQKRRASERGRLNIQTRPIRRIPPHRRPPMLGRLSAPAREAVSQSQSVRFSLFFCRYVRPSGTLPPAHHPSPDKSSLSRRSLLKYEMEDERLPPVVLCTGYHRQYTDHG